VELCGLDVQLFIEAYGLPGAVIVGLCYAVSSLWRAYTAVQNSRLDDARESAKETREIVAASNSALESLRRAIERGGING
jgi:hypothetical protein